MAHSTYSIIKTQTAPVKFKETLELTKRVVSDFLEGDNITEDELLLGKNYTKGYYKLNYLKSLSSIAERLNYIQITGKDIDYLSKRDQLVDAVNIDDVKRVIKRVFTVEPLIGIIGSAPEALN